MTRQKAPIRAAPFPPALLEAVGRVTIEWSYLESVMDAAIWRFVGANRDTGEALTAPLQFRHKLELLTRLFGLAAEREPSPSDRVAFDRLRDSLDKAATERNQIVHARWTTGAYGSPMTYEVTARNSLKRVTRGRPVSEIRNLADRIAEHAEALRTMFGIGKAEKDEPES